MKKYSLLSQIQYIIALEALSPTIIDIHWRKNSNPPQLVAYYTTTPNPNCIDLPEILDKYLIAPNHILKDLASYTTAQCAAEYIFSANNCSYLYN